MSGASRLVNWHVRKIALSCRCAGAPPHVAFRIWRHGPNYVQKFRSCSINSGWFRQMSDGGKRPYSPCYIWPDSRRSPRDDQEPLPSDANDPWRRRLKPVRGRTRRIWCAIIRWPNTYLTSRRRWIAHLWYGSRPKLVGQEIIRFYLILHIITNHKP